MKTTPLLLAASLLANVALIAFFATRSSGPANAPATRPAADLKSTDSPANSTALQTALASGEVAALIDAGVPAETARELALARKLAQLAAKSSASQAASSDGKWWRGRSNSTPAMREQQVAVRRELSDALVAAFGADLGLSGVGPQSQFAFLSPAKREALSRITQDYEEMMARFSGGGIQLASDREQLRLLRTERERDIAALLSPEEKLAYDMRSSSAGAMIRGRYGDAIESEAEFQKIFVLQKAFDEKFPREALTGRISPEMMAARAEAERQLDAELRASLGDNRYAALRRASDPDVRNLDGLVARLNLPAATTDTVLAARDTYAAESQRINSNTGTPLPERRTQIQALADRAKADVTRTLGNEAADAYAQNSAWLNFLRSGMAYSTAPQPGSPATFGMSSQSVFPVMPAGATGPATAARQMFISGAPNDPILGLGVERMITNANVQLITVSPVHGEPAAGATVVRPAQPAPPTAPAPAPKR